MARKDAEQTVDAPTTERTSSLTENSTYKQNPKPNPKDLKPEPGPSVVQEVGKP